MPTNGLEKNKEYIKNNFDKILNLYRNKYILVYEEKIVGSFDTYESAAEEGINTYGINSGFLVQLVTDKQPINFVSVALL